MTQDLIPGVLKHLGVGDLGLGVKDIPGVAYRTLVTRERLASAKATGTRWTSAKARAWRAQQFAILPENRVLLSESELDLLEGAGELL
jgi:hypothetical protein